MRITDVSRHQYNRSAELRGLLGEATFLRPPGRLVCHAQLVTLSRLARTQRRGKVCGQMTMQEQARHHGRSVAGCKRVAVLLLNFHGVGCSGDHKSFDDSKIQYNDSDRCRTSGAVVLLLRPILQPLEEFDGGIRFSSQLAAKCRISWFANSSTGE